ncbi:cytochrome C oxidase subunit IV family protein [Myxococcaceae bacterium GXIMD 01537]
MASVTNESRLEERNMQTEHHSGVARYVMVFAALLVLTLVTVFTGRMHLPTWGLALAMLIATTKGALVALFFMHLVDHEGANRLVFGVSILFVGLLMFFVLADVGTRFRPALPPGSPHSDLQEIVGPKHEGRFGGQMQAPDTHERHEP